MGGVIEGKFVGVQVLEKLSIKSTVIGENISQQIIPRLWRIRLRRKGLSK